MKTGCQWRELIVKEYFEDKISWQLIYYYFNKWSKDGSFRQVWIALLSGHKGQLDLSSAQFDDSHTPAKRGGEQVGYQGRKGCKTTNSLYLSDNKGQLLSVGSPQSGEHNDLYEITSIFEEMMSVLEEADITCQGIFLNADPGFDSEEFRLECDQKEIELNVKSNKRNSKVSTDQYRYFDDELYKRRTKLSMSMPGWMHLKHY